MIFRKDKDSAVKEKRKSAFDFRNIKGIFKNATVVGVACIAVSLLMFILLVAFTGHRTDNAVPTSSRPADIYKLPSGEMLMSIQVKNLADGLSGKLQPGDIVSAFCPQSTADGTQDQITPAENPPEMQFVQVASVTASTGRDTSPSTVKSGDTNENNLPATVTLIVNTKQAQILAGLENRNIHLALVYRGGGKKAADLLKQQDGILSADGETSEASSAPVTAGTSPAAENTQSTVSTSSSEVGQ